MEANDDPVDALVLEYLRATEAGEQPDLTALTDRLADAGQRDEVRQLVATATWARGTFPAPFRPELLVGGRYRLREHLGSGGFGKVWRARDEKLGRDVALKLFHPLLDPADLEDALRRERQALAAVHHEGIVRLLDSGRHEDGHFLVMELAIGRPLDRLLADLAGPDALFPPSRADVTRALGLLTAPGETSLLADDWFTTAAEVTIAILWALAAAHAQGVVHRDLKPANVLLRAGGHPVLLDFGLAGVKEQAGPLTGRLFGTAAYLAPEQLEREHMGKDVRTDVYQGGLLLYELLTLRRAFGADGRSSLLTAVRTGDLVPPRRLRRAVPAALEDVCLRALERDPARRYASAEAFAADLQRWRAGELPVASRLGRFGRLLRAGRKSVHRHRIAAAAVAALLLGATGTALLLPAAPPVTIVVRDGVASFEARKPAHVVVFALYRQADGSQVADFVPLRLEPGQGPVLTATVPAGPSSATLLVDEAVAPPRATRTFRALDLAPDEVAAWQVLAKAARRRIDERGQPLSAAQLGDLRDELNQPGRGGGPRLDGLDLRRVFD